MARAATAPAWFILEYLSAEPWVEGAHGLASPHPRLPLPRRFWFPGFTAEDRRPPPRARSCSRRATHSGATTPRSRRSGPRSEFRRRRRTKSASRSSAIRIRCCRRCSMPGPTATTPSCASCPTVSPPARSTCWTAGNVPHPGHPLRRGRLTLHAIPFVPQDDYDRLLWSSSVNFVRGEDSFVRAQWAARACVVAHLSAAGGRPLAEARRVPRRATRPASTPAARRRCVRFWRAWNGARRRRADRRRMAGVRRGAPRDRPACRALGGAARRPARARVRAGQGGPASGIIKGFPNQPLIAIQVQ